jgi:biotin carboxylase
MGRLGLLFDYDWDAVAHARHAQTYSFARAGFDLFSFPSNAHLVRFDLDRFADQQARRAQRERWVGVLSHHEQFGALAAALVAERAGLAGPSPLAIAACQHKLYARELLQRVAPEACPAYAPLQAEYGGPIPQDLQYPLFVKPVKAAFSVLARRVQDHAELHRFTRFGRRELWVIRRLVEPFERVARQRLPASAGTAHRLMTETPLQAPQFNLDGWVQDGKLQVLGFMDAVMYPGTQAFMRFENPSRLDATARQAAVDVAQRFLTAAGFDHGFFNMEFFYEPSVQRLTVIEFNPRLASQFGDLYRRTSGLDAHRMALDLAAGGDPARSPTEQATAGASASFVFRAFSPAQIPAMPTAAQQQSLQREFPDALLMVMPKAGHGLARDFKWLGSHRYGILHLGGRDAADLRARCERASALLGWPAPYALPADAPQAEQAAYRHLREVAQALS